MPSTSSQQMPPSAQLMDMIFAFTLSRSIAVAAQFSIADLLSAGPKSATELGDAIGADSRSVYRMMRALSGAGVFLENADGRFGLTQLSQLLRSDNPESLRAFAALMADEINFQIWAELPYSIKNGKPATPYKLGIPWFDWLGQHPEKGREFNDAMTSLSAGAAAAVVSAYDFSGIETLVDIGGGHGLLLASVLSKYPKMRGVLYDTPMVIKDAGAVLAAHGVPARCEVVGGDFLKSAPAGGDAYILKHIIHDWSDDECVTILSHCHAGMTARGKVLIVEMVIPEPNVPSVSKFLDLEMLLFLTGRERTESEYRDLLKRSGFTLTRIVPTPSPYSVIEGVRD